MIPIVPIRHNGSIVSVESVFETTLAVAITDDLFILSSDGILSFNMSHPDVISSAVITRNYQISYKHSQGIRLAKNMLNDYDTHYIGDDVVIQIALPVVIDIVVEAVLVVGASPVDAIDSITQAITDSVFYPAGADPLPSPSEVLSLQQLSDVTEPIAVTRLGAVVRASHIIEATHTNTLVDRIKSVTVVKQGDTPTPFGLVAMKENEYPVLGNIEVKVSNV